MPVRLLPSRSSGRSRSRSRRRVVAATALVTAAVTVLGACSDTGGQASGPPPPPEPAPLAAFYDQQLQWGPCSDYASTPDDAASFANPELDCTRVRVPLNYERPQGETAEIALTRRKATGSDRIGSLFINPGGPGVSGTGSFAGQVEELGRTPLAARFDLIGFDPRGVGASRPAIDCMDDRENDAERAKVFDDPSPAGVTAAEANAKQYADRCAQKTGADTLAVMGTRDAARDMDILRAAVGDEKFTYLGYSYGTELGTAYAEAFPLRVRALVLDGAIDPTQSTIDSSVKQSGGFQLAFDNFAKDCTTKPDCPLGTDPAQATARFQAIMRSLLDKPVPVGDGRMLSFADAQTGVTQALYLSQLWPVLQRGISEVATGRGRLLMRLADFYYKRDMEGQYTNELEAFQAISCVDRPPLTDPAQVKQQADETYQVAPFQTTGRGPVEARNACAFWPVPPTSTPHTPKAPGLAPTLVISTTGDPATPYQAGVDLATQLSGSLLKVNGNQHTVALQGTPCVDQKVIDYLVELDEPDQGAECTVTRS